MELFWEGVREAVRLVGAGDPLVLGAALRSLWISSLAVTLACAVGVPGGTLLARFAFPGRRLVVLACRAGMAVPTVFVGLVCYGLFSRRGPLGPLELLYTPWAIVAGEVILALPIVLAITHGAVRSLDARVAETAWTLGARPLRRWLTYISEARLGVMLAVLTAFARCVTELGVAMMVGGNIKMRTRTLATATALETGRGEFARGLAMGALLLLIALGVTAVIASLGRDEEA
ncbi:MAG TPA: ABC transporter permease subunit [Planctomycetaceae bacterium]|nr:ABC transporter permease subunit [Planctomycetaceae bacterium]